MKPATNKVIASPPPPGSDDWQKLITASKVPAILGLSPWSSPYQVWHEMKGLYVEEYDDDRPELEWGHYAEIALINWWKGHYPHETKPTKFIGTTEQVAYTNTSLPFPNLATLDSRAYYGGRHYHIVECKTTGLGGIGYWGRPGEENSVPVYYQVQVQFQMIASGIDTATVIVQSSGAPEMHEIVKDEEAQNIIINKCDQFYRSLQSDTPPPLDDTVATYEVVRGMHPDIDREMSVEIDPELGNKFIELTANVKTMEQQLRGVKTRILDSMGKARTATVDGERVAIRYPVRGNNIALKMVA